MWLKHTLRIVVPALVFIHESLSPIALDERIIYSCAFSLASYPGCNDDDNDDFMISGPNLETKLPSIPWYNWSGRRYNICVKTECSPAQ